MKMPIVNLDKFTSFNQDLLDNQIKQSLKLYDQFIMDNLIFQENEFSYNQIKEILYKWKIFYFITKKLIEFFKK